VVISYSTIMTRREEISRRISLNYVQGRSWKPIFGRRVVSLGCGSVEGSQFREITSVASLAVGVDSDPLSGAHYTSLSDVPTGEFDALVAEHVVEHMTHDQVVDSFAQAARILSPGGVVIITVPNVSNFGAWFSNHDHRNFTPPLETAAILELSGFHVLTVFGWSKPARHARHMAMGDEERRLCAFVEENWGLTLPQYITIGAVRADAV